MYKMHSSMLTRTDRTKGVYTNTHSGLPCFALSLSTHRARSQTQPNCAPVGSPQPCHKLPLNITQHPLLLILAQHMWP